MAGTTTRLPERGSLIRVPRRPAQTPRRSSGTTSIAIGEGECAAKDY